MLTSERAQENTKVRGNSDREESGKKMRKRKKEFNPRRDPEIFLCFVYKVMLLLIVVWRVTSYRANDRAGCFRSSDSQAPLTDSPHE